MYITDDEMSYNFECIDGSKDILQNGNSSTNIRQSWAVE